MKNIACLRETHGVMLQYPQKSYQLCNDEKARGEPIYWRAKWIPHGEKQMKKRSNKNTFFI